MTPTAIDVNELLEFRPDDNGGQFVVRGSKVTVQRIGGLYLNGESPHTIAREAFPWLKEAAVFAALAFFLDHRAEFDAAVLAEHQEAMRAARELGAEVIFTD